MKWFRNVLAKNRAFVLTTLAVSLYGMVGGPDFAYAHQLHQQKEERLQEVADTLGIPVEKLRPDHLTLAETLGKAFGVEPEDPVKKAGMERLQKVLREHEEQLAANPYLPQIEQVKNEHAIYRIEGTLQDILQLTDPKGRKALRPGAKKAMMRNLKAAFDEGLKLPPLPEGLPAKAQQRHEEMQRTLNRITAFVRPVVEEAVEETSLDKSAELNPEKIVRMKQLTEGLVERTKRAPRFIDRPLPLRRVDKKARVQEISQVARSSQPSAAIVTGRSQTTVPSKAGIAPELQALAEDLENSPAQIFSFVHNEVEFDPKWGAFKGSLETYWARSGTPWEQAWLLRDLLVAAGVDARFEWGEVEIDTETLMNITGVQDPWRAGDMMTTAGVPIVLLTQGSQVVKARMSHVWVKAFVDYIPNRGATAGPGDTWIRMDPSIKQFNYAPGIPIYEQVPFSLGDYLLSGTELSPRRAYEETLWDYIRANNIDCVTLEQLKPKGSILAEDFVILPGTLRAKILEVSGEAANVPETFQQRISVEVRRPSGERLLTWDVRQPATFAQRLEIGWRGATPDDQATLDSYGGVFETPPYLVDLVPVLRLGGTDQVAGTALGSAEEIEIVVTTSPPGGVTDVFVHQGHAGEPSVLVTAFGKVPRELTDVFQSQLNAADSAGSEAEIEMATLQLLGATYFQNLGRDTVDLAEWNWHRVVRLVSEGLAVQTGTVTTTAGGAPLTFERAERFVDFPGFVVGVFHAKGRTDQLRPAMELAGAQGSFLEGQVFDQVLEEEGIAAVSALTRAQREGQSITMVDSSNVDTVLASAGLSDEIESQVRQAVAQGKVGWIPELPITVNSWQGVGFILEDPSSGAAGFLLDGGYAGGSGTGRSIERLVDILGNEDWLIGSPFAEILQLLREDFSDDGDGDDTDGPATTQSDPVNMSSGNFWSSQIDLSILARGLGMVWRRTYNSRSSISGPLGFGWTFSFGERLERRSDGSVVYTEEDGTRHLFQEDAGSFIAPPGKASLTLTEELGGYQLTSKEGVVSSFDTSGRLLAISDTNSNRILLTYNEAGDLSSVIGPSGRTLLEISSTNGKIVGLVDLAGREITYEYSGEDLVAVTGPMGNWTYQYDQNHNLIARIDSGGSMHSYAYDTIDRCVAHVDPLGHTERFSYSQSGGSASLTNPNGHVTYLAFDQKGRATMQVDPLGNATASTWDDFNNRTTTVDARGGVTSRTFDERGNLTSEVNALGEEIHFVYEPQYGRITNIVNPAGGQQTFEYDGRGNLKTRSTETEEGTVSESYFYNEFGQILEIKDSEGDSTQFEWNELTGSPSSRTDASGGKVMYQADALGRVQAIVDSSGRTTALTEYNEMGRVTKVTDAHGSSVEIDYDPMGRPAKMSSLNGEVSVQYDLVGNVTKIVNHGEEFRFQYDAAGNETLTIDPDGGLTFRYYDALGRLLLARDAKGYSISMGYCGDVGGESFCHFTDEAGHVTLQELDILGRVTRVTNPLGQVLAVEYDELGRKKTLRDALMRTTHFEFDAFDQLTAVVDAAGGRTEYSYDAKGNVVAETDAKGRRWLRRYDGIGRLISAADPLGNTVRNQYDDLGNLTIRENADGRVVSYKYDDGRLARVDLAGGESETFEYDLKGSLVRMANPSSAYTFEYDGRGRPVKKLDEFLQQEINYSYGLGDRLESMSTPQGTVLFHYDQVGRLVAQVDPVVGSFEFAYDASGRVLERRYPNGWVTRYTYSEVGQVETLVTEDSSGQIRDAYRYSYDAVGNRISTISAIDQAEHTYTYDDLDRLVRWERSDGLFEEYTYDSVGNRLAMADESGVTNYFFDAANQLLSEVRTPVSGEVVSTERVWDANGNISELLRGSEVTRYTFDSLNRLRQVSEVGRTFSYSYAPDGSRVSESDGVRSKRFLYSKEDIVAEYDSSGGPEIYYSHGPGFDLPLAQQGSQGIHYFHHDGLGSVSTLSAQDGSAAGHRSYRPFGSVQSSAGVSSDWGYTSRQLDRSGLMYYRARYYEPEAGRFLSRDSFEGFSANPRSRHRYTYVENNPINMVDPTGNVGIKAAGVMLLGIAALQIYTFFSFLLPETLAILRSQVVGNPVSFYYGRLAGTLLYEIVVLAAAGVYAQTGWALVGSGPASTARLRGLAKLRWSTPVKDAWALVSREAKFVFNIANLAKVEFWALAISAGCLALLKPLAVTFRWTSLNTGALVVSVVFCVLGVFGVLGARRIWHS